VIVLDAFRGDISATHCQKWQVEGGHDRQGLTTLCCFMVHFPASMVLVIAARAVRDRIIE
jgi:hypothetical protein